MPNTIIKLIVNTDVLQQLSQQAGSQYNYNPLNNSWAKIRLEGDGVGDQPPGTTDPSDYKSTVYVGDTLTFKGELDGAVNIPEGTPTPVINITGIEWSGEITNLNNNSDTRIFEQHKIDMPEDGGNFLRFDIQRAFPKLLDFQNFTIHFVISYRARLLDPKIKVIARPNA